jgi:hypothetical protein
MAQTPLPAGPQLQELERRCRTVTGVVLAVVAFAACYGLLLVEDQTALPRSHFYPLIAGALFYLAGDLLAMLWFRILAAQVQAFLEHQERQAKAAPAPAPGPEVDVDADDGVEVIHPRAGGR